MGRVHSKSEFFTEEQLQPDYFPAKGKFKKGDMVKVFRDPYKRYKYLLGRIGIVVGWKAGFASTYQVEFEGIGKRYVLSNDMKEV